MIRSLFSIHKFSLEKLFIVIQCVRFPLLLLVLPFLIAISFTSCGKGDDYRWRRGNMHTHTFWSDGDDFPELVAKWYKDHGYDFLVFTDHNMLLEGERWRRFPENHHALVRYINLIGANNIDKRADDEDGYVQVRLKALEEFRKTYEEPGKYLLIMGNEITDQHAVHLLAIHQDEVISTVGGTDKDRVKMIKGIVDRVEDYRNRSGRNVYAALAHPNFRWAITAEMMLEADKLRFFEVYNGHPAVYNEGDEFRAGTERMWDIVLAHRLSKGSGQLLYGLATDDTHRYHSEGATPGRGWVMVRTSRLTAENILDAIDRGEFYASTGVMIREIKFNGKKISVKIESREGIEYLTEYIGTLRGLDTSGKPVTDEEGNEVVNTTHTYSSDIGKVLAASAGLKSSYTLTGDELYVRVRITSNADQLDNITGEVIGKQKAWIQPVIRAGK